MEGQLITTRLLFAAVAALGSFGDLASQRTWTVDKLGRPGFDFTEIDPAVQAADPGDLILVRSANAYQPATITKGVRIVGDGRPMLPDLEIRDIPPTELVSAVDLVICWSTAGTGALRVRDCQGAVILDKLVASPLCAFPFPVAIQHRIENCAFVTIRDGEFRSRDLPTAITDSFVVFQTTNVQSDFSALGLATAAMAISRSRVTILDSSVLGACTAAFEATDSDIIVAGRSTVATAFDPCFPPLPAVSTTGGTLLIDPRATLDLSLGHGTARIRRNRLAATLAGDAVRGTAMPLTVYGARNGAMATVAGVLTLDPAHLPGLGPLWLDPTNVWIPVDAGTLSTFGRRRTTVPIGTAVPRGFPLTFQSLEANSDGFRLSIPSLTTIR